MSVVSSRSTRASSPMTRVVPSYPTKGVRVGRYVSRQPSSWSVVCRKGS